MKQRDKDRNVEMPSTGSESDRNLRRDEETRSREIPSRDESERERQPGEGSPGSSDSGRL